MTSTVATAYQHSVPNAPTYLLTPLIHYYTIQFGRLRLWQVIRSHHCWCGWRRPIRSPFQGFLEDVGIRWLDPFVIMRIRFYHLKAKLLVKLYGAVVVHLDVSGIGRGFPVS